MRSSRRPGVAPSGELVAAPPPSGRRRKRQQIRSRGDFRQQAVSQVAVTFGLSRARAAGPGARWCRGHTDDRGSKFQDATRADSAVPQRGAETCQLKHSSRNRGLPGRVVLTPLCSSGPCAHHVPVLIMPQCSRPRPPVAARHGVGHGASIAQAGCPRQPRGSSGKETDSIPLLPSLGCQTRFPTMLLHWPGARIGRRRPSKGQATGSQFPLSTGLNSSWKSGHSAGFFTGLSQCKHALVPSERPPKTSPFSLRYKSCRSPHPTSSDR